METDKKDIWDEVDARLDYQFGGDQTPVDVLFKQGVIDDRHLPYHSRDTIFKTLKSNKLLPEHPYKTCVLRYFPGPPRYTDDDKANIKLIAKTFNSVCELFGLDIAPIYKFGKVPNKDKANVLAFIEAQRSSKSVDTVACWIGGRVKNTVLYRKEKGINSNKVYMRNILNVKTYKKLHGFIYREMSNKTHGARRLLKTPEYKLLEQKDAEAQKIVHMLRMRAFDKNWLERLNNKLYGNVSYSDLVKRADAGSFQTLSSLCGRADRGDFIWTKGEFEKWT